MFINRLLVRPLADSKCLTVSSDFQRKAREIFYTVISTFIGIHFILTFLDSRFHVNDIVCKTFTTTSDQGA